MSLVSCYRDGKRFVYRYRFVKCALDDTDQQMLRFVQEKTSESISNILRTGIKMQYNKLRYEKKERQIHDYSAHF